MFVMKLFNNPENKKHRQSILFLVFFIFLPVYMNAQTEVMAWGNITGIRIDGQLMEFESSLRVAGREWTAVNATGKERQRPRYDREGDTQTVTTEVGSVKVLQVVNGTAEIILLPASFTTLIGK
jgi:hypothetical protein